MLAPGSDVRALAAPFRQTKNSHGVKNEILVTSLSSQTSINRSNRGLDRRNSSVGAVGLGLRFSDIAWCHSRCH
jgi:hypothetical protein